MIEKGTSKPMKNKEMGDDRRYDSLAAAHDDKQRQLPPELLPEEQLDGDESSSSETRDGKRWSSEEVGEEIVKELKNIKRQNTITHCLLTASILVTLAWQLSELSLIFKMKQGFKNPLKSIRGAIKGMFDGIGKQDNSDEDSSSHVLPPTGNLPGLKFPDLDLPGFETSNDEDDD